MPRPLYFISSCLLFYLAYTEFGQVQFVGAYLPSCCLRWIRHQRGQILPYVVCGHIDGFFCTFSILEDAYTGKHALDKIPSVQCVIRQEPLYILDDGYKALVDVPYNLIHRGRVHLVAPYRYVHLLLLSLFPGGLATYFNNVIKTQIRQGVKCALLFTELPRRGLPGNWASDVGDSRKLNIFYYSCLKALHIGSLTSRVSELRRTRNLFVTVLQYVDAIISLLP